MEKEGTCALLCIATITAPTARPCCFPEATKSPLAQSTGQPGMCLPDGELLRTAAKNQGCHPLPDPLRPSDAEALS